MLNKLVTWAALAIVAANFLLLVPAALTPRRYTDDVNTHYFWLNFRKGEYHFADELHRFQSIGWRAIGSALGRTPVAPYTWSGLITLAIYGSFLGLAFWYARRRCGEESLLPPIFVLLLALHPTLARDMGGGLPRSWAGVAQMLGLLTALEFSRRQAGALAFAAVMHPISLIVNVGVMGLEWVYKCALHVKKKVPLDWKKAGMFATVVIVIVGGLWLDQRRIARIDGEPLKTREHEAFEKNHRSETDQIRSLGEAFERKFLSSGDQDYNYILFAKRLNYENDKDKRNDMRRMARARRYLILLVCAVGIYFAWKRRLMPREMIWWAVAGVILYYLAVLLAWRLYAPDRYIFPMAVVVPSWLMAVCFATAIRKLGWPGVTPLIVFLLLWGTGVHPTYLFKNWDKWEGVTAFMRENVDRDALIAGHPRDTDPIPMLAGRKVLVAREYIQPWRPKLYDRNMKLSEHSLELLYLTRDRVGLIKETGVDYILVGKEWMSEDCLKGEEEIFDEPIDSRIVEQLKNTNPDVLIFNPENNGSNQDAIIFEDENFLLFDLSRIASEDADIGK